jgi:hypothetical protein
MTILQSAFTLLLAGILIAAFDDRRWWRWLRRKLRD